MHNPILIIKLEVRLFFLSQMTNLFGNCLPILICKKDRSDVRILDVCEISSVLFLLRQRFLVLFYPVLFIVINGACANDAILCLVFYLLGVNIESRSGVLLEPLILNKVLQIEFSSLVYLWRIWV